MTKDGTKLASGQITHMGYLAQILIWDISEIGSGQPRLLHTLKLHKVQIQALAFSCNGRCGHRAGAHLGGVPWWQWEGSGMRGGEVHFPKYGRVSRRHLLAGRVALWQLSCFDRWPRRQQPRHLARRGRHGHLRQQRSGCRTSGLS